MNEARVELAADLGELSRLAGFVMGFADSHALPGDVAGALNLALEEVVTNVIRHGYGGGGNSSVRVRLTTRAGEVTAEVEDEASPFDPLARAAPDLHRPIEERPIGGLGIHLVRNLMDTLEYQRADGKNRLILTKRWASIR